jgi:hypothetical protein
MAKRKGFDGDVSVNGMMPEFFSKQSKAKTWLPHLDDAANV